jgi:hypothetical protein
MSHVSALKIKVKNLSALAAAAKDCGLEFREGQKTWKWYGQFANDYHGDDAAYRQGVTPAEYGKCDHALSIPGNSHAYEVGVKDNKDGTFMLLWDFWADGHGLKEKIGEHGNKLQQAYSKHCVIHEAAAKGYEVEKIEVLEKGGLQVHLQEKV